MYTYYYYFLMLLLIVIHAKVDTDEIKRGKPINHNLEFLIFLIITLLSMFILYTKDAMPFIKWCIYCGITAPLLRAGFYDFTLNLLRGKSMWYISPNADGNYTGTKESWYDDILGKLKINANHIRMAALILSIVWLFIHTKFFN